MKRELTISKRKDGWRVVDEEGHDVGCARYDTKREALDRLRVIRSEIRNAIRLEELSLK